MSLTNHQIIALAQKMGTPLERICFKDELKDEPLKYNRGYIVNLSDSVFQDGTPAEGTHYVAFFVKKSMNGKVEPIAFDSYGVAPCQEIMDYISNGKTPPYNKIDIQNIMNEACGFYCLAFLYFISSKSFPHRTNSLYEDSDHFLSLFNDLNKSADWKYNEFVLKHFFRSSDKAVRDANPIDILGKQSQFNVAKGVADVNSINTKV